MNKSMRFLSATLYVLGLVIALEPLRAQADGRPWLAPANPTILEWVVLALQADEGDAEFGDNDLTVAFYLGPKAVDYGVIYCQIRFLPNANAEIVQMVEQGIRARFFERSKRLYPWATLEVVKEVARPSARQ